MNNRNSKLFNFKAGIRDIGLRKKFLTIFYRRLYHPELIKSVIGGPSLGELLAHADGTYYKYYKQDWPYK